MIISKKLEKAINQQVGNEFGASMQYLEIASYFDGDDLSNFAEVFFLQAEEERDHAMKFLNFLLEADAHVSIPEISKPRDTFESAEDAVGAALTWEKEVTKQIYNLMDIAVEDKDYISQQFLQWFVAEQLEEISKMSTILGIVRKAGDNLLLAEQLITQLPAEGESAPADE
jgi:ferritin